MLSFWEQESFVSYDLIVIGAGITGMSTAASFKEKHPNTNVLIIERGTLPTGASTKNAGFACFGSISELATDRKTLGDEGMVSLVQSRWLGLQKTIARLGEKNIGFIKQGGYELLNAGTEHYLNDIDEVNSLLNPVFKQPVFEHATSRLHEFGFGQTSHLVFNPLEAQLHTGKLMKNLWLYCNQLGIQIITGTTANNITESNQGTIVETDHITFKSTALAICTNAFTQSLVKEHLNILPGRGMVMLIKPESPIKFRGTFHYDEGYFYFRDFEDKIIFGGARNVALEEENTSEFGLNNRVEKKLVADLRSIILPNSGFSIEMKWSGIMAFGDTKAPIVKKLTQNQYLGVRLGGMGVALASLVGEELATEISRNHF